MKNWCFNVLWVFGVVQNWNDEKFDSVMGLACVIIKSKHNAHKLNFGIKSKHRDTGSNLGFIIKS